MSKIEEVINQRTGNAEVFLNGRRLDDFDDHTAIQLEILKKLLTIDGESGGEIDLSHIEELLLEILNKTGEATFDEAVQTIIVENNNLANQLNEAKSTINKLNDEIHILLVNKKKLEEDLKAVNTQLKEARTSLANTIQQKNELSKELKQYKQDNEQLKESSRKQSKQIAELKSSNSTKDLTIKRLQERVNELSSGDLAKENNELKMRIYRLDNDLYNLRNKMQNAAACGWSDAMNTFGCLC